MTIPEIKAAIDDNSKKMRQAKHDYDKEIMQLRHERKMIQMECPHEWRTRNIMGRMDVTECIHCDMER